MSLQVGGFWNTTFGYGHAVCMILNNGRNKLLIQVERRSYEAVVVGIIGPDSLRETVKSIKAF